MLHITITSEKNPYGSKNYNVTLTHVRLRARSEDDAVAFADKLADAVDAHTLDSATIDDAY